MYACIHIYIYILYRRRQDEKSLDKKREAVAREYLEDSSSDWQKLLPNDCGAVAQLSRNPC